MQRKKKRLYSVLRKVENAKMYFFCLSPKSWVAVEKLSGISCQVWHQRGTPGGSSCHLLTRSTPQKKQQAHNNQMHEYGMCTFTAMPRGSSGLVQRSVSVCDTSYLNPGDTSVQRDWIIHPRSCHTHTHIYSPVTWGAPRASYNFRALHLDVSAARSTPLKHSNEPASTQSKSSDDTDVGRLIFTLDLASSPLDCCVYLPAQLVSGEDRQTTKEGREGWRLPRDYISSNCF